MFNMLMTALFETLYMTFISTIISYILGLPLGIILVITDKDGISPNRPVNIIIGTLVNVFRSIPFIILMLAISPFTKLIVQTTIGTKATIVPLIVSATPFIARLVESSIKEIDGGVIEAAQSMGASNRQIVWKVMLTEAKPAILVGSVVALITILGYSAMAGVVGGGGLGTIAINYGLYKFDGEVMWITIAVLVMLVQVLQEVGMRIARRSDNRL